MPWIDVPPRYYQTGGLWLYYGNVTVQSSAITTVWNEELGQRLPTFAAADDVADKLLTAHLDAEQLAEFKRNRSFVVTVGGDKPIFGRPETARPVRRYRLRWGWVRNIDELDATGKRIGVLCIHPTTQLPIADNLLAQKLMIEADEQRFLRIANRSEAA